MATSARKVVTRSPARAVRILNLRGVLPDPVEAESSLERDFVLRACLHPNVERIRHQPFRLTLQGGKSYTPDFLIELRSGGRVVIEVKITSKVPSYRDIFDLASEHLRGRGLEFAVADERSIRHDLAHRRAARLLRYVKTTFDDAECTRALATLTSMEPSHRTLGELARRAAVMPEILFHLIGRRQLVLGPDLSLDDSAVIHPHHEFSGECHVDHFTAWLGLAPWNTNDRDGA